MTIPDCECIWGLPLNDKLDAIYCVYYQNAQSTVDLPTCECVKGMPLQDKVSAIFCALLQQSGGGGAPTVDELIALGVYEPGDVKYFSGDISQADPPAGWLYCNGQAISRATYSALFARIGVLWGAGNGTTTFNIPDLQGRVLAHSQSAGTDRLEIAAGNPGGFASQVCSATGGNAGETLTGAQTGIGGTSGVTAGSDFNAVTLGSFGSISHIQPTALMNAIIFTGVI